MRVGDAHEAVAQAGHVPRARCREDAHRLYRLEAVVDVPALLKAFDLAEAVWAARGRRGRPGEDGPWTQRIVRRDVQQRQEHLVLIVGCATKKKMEANEVGVILALLQEANEFPVFATNVALVLAFAFCALTYKS